MNQLLLKVIRAQDTRLPARERREAFGCLVDAHQDAAFALAFSILRQRQQAEDAALEGFVEAWRRIATLKNPEAFATWLRAIVRRKATRRLGERPQDSLSEQNRVRATDGHLQIWLEQAIDRLPKTQREALILFYIAGLSREETAVFMGCSLLATKKRLARALSQMRTKESEMSNQEFKEMLPSHGEGLRARALLLSGEFAELLTQQKPIAALNGCIAKAGQGAAADAFEDMKTTIMMGLPISEAMRRHPNIFTAKEAAIVNVGEELGHLDDVLRRLASGSELEPEALRAEYQSR